MSSPPTSPSRLRSGSTSPARRRNTNPNSRSNVPYGFLPTHKPKQTPISQMPLWELQSLYNKNVKILAAAGDNTSSYVQRITREQAEIQEQLVEVHGMESINTGLKNTKITGEEDAIDVEMNSPDPPPMIDAKKRALEKFGATAGPSHIGMLGLEEAIQIEQRAIAHDLQRKERMEEKQRHHGYPQQSEIMTREEREARIWAFMNYKPSDSDLEDDDEDEDGDDPAGWFEDDQDDGRKGQNIVEPDEEDPDSLHNIIRVIDPNQTHSGIFYEPRDDGD